MTAPSEPPFSSSSSTSASASTPTPIAEEKLSTPIPTPLPSHRRGSSIGSSTSPSSSTRNRSNSNSANALTPTPSHHQPAHSITRQRRSSSLIQHLEPDTLDTKIDQALNLMSMPMGSSKGAWVIHVVIIILVKMIFNLLVF